MKGLFISGTDTDVGKTVTSAIFALHASTHFSSIHYQKPIQTGLRDGSDMAMVKSLIGDTKNILCSQGLGFKKPLSPHVAAYLEQTHIDFQAVINTTVGGMGTHFNLIEGAGGLMVPINNHRLMIDLVKAVALPCVLVARSGLGTINHTLLSLEALRVKNIAIFGVVMVGPRNMANEQSIRYYGQINNLLSLPWLAHITPTEITCLIQQKHQQLVQFFSGENS